MQRNKVTPVEAYKMHTALKLHFTQEKYDYFKFLGKTKASPVSFNKRKDKFFYQKIARKFPNRKELELLYVSQLIQNPNFWIGDIFTPSNEKYFCEYKSKLESIYYIFEQDLIKLKEKLNDKAKIDNSQFPALMRYVLSGEINVETFIILDSIYDLVNKWSKTIDDEYIWPEFKRKILKYMPFVKYDKKKILLIFKKIVKNS